MEENAKTNHPTVILPLDKYEKLIRENERLNAVTGPLIRAIRDSLFMTDNGDVWMNPSPITQVFKAVCPDYYDEWLVEAERQRAEKDKDIRDALAGLMLPTNG